MIRTLGGIAVGIGVAVIVMVLVEGLGNRMFGLALSPDQALPVTDAGLPDGVQASVVAGWFLGTFVGATAALRIGRAAIAAWAVAAVVVLAVIVRILLSATPVPMAVGGMAGPVAAAWLAQRLARPGRAGTAR